MVNVIVKIAVILLCLGADTPRDQSAPIYLQNGRNQALIPAEIITSISGISASLNLDEDYTGSYSSQEKENLSERAKEPEPVRSPLPNSPVEFDETPLNEAGHGLPFNLFMILTGLTLLVLLYLHRRREATVPQEPTTHIKTPDNEPHRPLPPDLPVYEWDDKRPEAASFPDPIGSVHDDKIPDLDHDLDNELSLREIRKKAREHGKVDVGHLIYLLETTRDPYNHSRALYLMGKYRVREALPMIFNEMASPQPWVRIAAAAALVKLKSNVVEERMIEFAEFSDFNLRAAALLVLSRIGTPRSHEVIRKSIWDFEPEVRKAAALGIGRLKVLNAEFDIKEAMTDFEFEVREMAAWAYNRINQRIQGQG